MQTYEEILAGLCELLTPFAEGEEGLGGDTDLIDELDLSSLKIMDILMEVEDQYDVTVPLNKLPDIRTIGDLAKMLHKLVNESSS